MPTAVPYGLYEPLPAFRDHFREAFAENARNFFERLVERSGIDTAANARTVSELKAAEKALAAEAAKRAAWGWGVGVTAILMAGAAILCVASFSEGNTEAGLAAAVTAASAAAALFGVCIPQRKRHAVAVAAMTSRRDDLKAEAMGQMASLNSLFDWDIPARIVEETVPNLKFDPFLTIGRLAELREKFGWDDAFSEGKSVLCAQSGEINGNPFVFASLLNMRMGSRTYTGSRTVSWPETERAPDGKIRIVTRTQTLTATVEKPFPEYSNDVLLIYGNDAAPNLRFTREPSSLSASSDGFLSRMRMKGRIRSLERFSRNLDDEFGYTIMGNREFEALFQTKDRNDEVEYRLLFTPLAQKQMLALLKDREVGYGDDFSFVKANKINAIRAGHLVHGDLDANPDKFADFDLDSSRDRFLSFCNRFFKSTYFAMAPLLSIPLYSQMRTHDDIYRDIQSRRSCFWEHESIANFLGEGRFRHPDSATRNILKTSVRERDGEAAEVEVTAYGYRKVQRVDVKTVHARNGMPYLVEVPWDEYVPVSRTSDMHISEREGLSRETFDASLSSGENWREYFRNWGAFAGNPTFRRSIASF